jgi:predicted ATPase
VPRTTAIAIGLRDEPQHPVIDLLCDYLRDKQTLIILDNCEHLIEACASLTDKLLHAAPNLRILTSSRETLGIPGEVNYRVPSLGLPSVEKLPTVESFSQYEAVSLFIDRAKSAVPNFVVANENAPAVAQICYRLDGIPLAIELAAAKLHVLSVEQIAQRLDDRFRLLTSSTRVRLERHQTLRAAIDWSYNLLSPSEQILLRRLSVFVGGWTLEAAETVCASESVKSDEVLNLLEQLINKSLVIVEEGQHESRCQMLETIRQYANEKLIEARESDTLRDKHLDYFRAVAEQAKPQFYSEQQVIWLKRFDTELDNIRAALVWAQNRGSVKAGLHLAVDLQSFWTLRYYLREPALALENLLAKVLSSDQMQLLAQAHNVAGWLLYLSGNSAAGLAHANESERLCLQLGSAGKAYLASVRNLLISIQVYEEHNPDRALPMLEENLKLLKEVGDQQGMAKAIHSMGMALTQRYDLIGARQAFERSLALYRDCGDSIGVVSAQQGLAGIALEEGKYAEARQRFEAILSFYRQASVFLKLDEPLWFLGAIAIREEDYARAKAWYTECLLFDQQIGDPDNQLPECLIGFAGIANAEKHFERGAQLLGAADTQIKARAVSLENFDQREFERLTTILRKELGDEKFEAFASQGRLMTMEQAIAYALEEPVR